MSGKYLFFSHKDCEYYPCHNGADKENFNCLFCYCPLYYLGNNCGGDFTILSNGIKDCSECLYPHQKENYPEIVKRLKNPYRGIDKTEKK